MLCFNIKCLLDIWVFIIPFITLSFNPEANFICKVKSFNIKVFKVIQHMTRRFREIRI